MMTNQQIQQQARQLRDYVVRCRRVLHTYAEPSGTEFRTSAFVRRELEGMGLPVEAVSTTGLLATLDTGRPGPGIALRADLDALPMHEEPENLAGPRSCLSENPNGCHACGHDAHAAMLLGAAQALAVCRQELTGTLYFCFEEGEENGGGVRQMLAALAQRRVDTCWAIHVYAGLDSGRLCVDAGPRMAGAAGVDIQVIGRGGHGSRPDLSINPVFCAASILTNVSTAWVNQIAAGETVTLGVTQLHGGESGNIIPDTASLSGSLRFFNKEEGEKAVRIFKSVAEHTAAMNNCRVEFGRQMAVICAPVVNDAHFAALAQRALPEVLPAGALVHAEPWYASESFSRYASTYPSVFAHLGIRNLACGAGAAHHNGFFDVDEDALPLGLLATLKYVAAVQAETAAQRREI